MAVVEPTTLKDELSKEAELKEVSDKLIESLTFDVAKTMQHPLGREKFLEFLRSGDFDHSGHSGKFLIYIDNLERKFGSAKVTGRMPLQEGDEGLLEGFKFLSDLLIDENFPEPFNGEGCRSYQQSLDTILASSHPIETYNKEMVEWNNAHDSMLGVSHAEGEKLGFWGEAQRQVFGILRYDKFPRFIDLIQTHSRDFSQEYKINKLKGNSFDTFDVEKLRTLRVALKRYIEAIDNEGNETGIKPIKGDYNSYKIIKNFINTKILYSAKEKLVSISLCEQLFLIRNALDQDTFITATQPTVDALLVAIREVSLDILKNEAVKNPSEKPHLLEGHGRKFSLVHRHSNHSRNSSSSVASGSSTSPMASARGSKPSSRSSSPSSRISSSPITSSQTSSRTPSPTHGHSSAITITTTTMTKSPAHSPAASPQTSARPILMLGLPPIHPTGATLSSQSAHGASAVTHTHTQTSCKSPTAEGSPGQPVLIHYGSRGSSASQSSEGDKSKTATATSLRSLPPV